jgi:hypothetical protein
MMGEARVTDSSPEFREFVDQVGRAASDFVAGDPAPYRALWSDGDDVSIFGGWATTRSAGTRSAPVWSGPAPGSSRAEAPSRRC